jgi:hypothetical protein
MMSQIAINITRPVNAKNVHSHTILIPIESAQESELVALNGIKQVANVLLAIMDIKFKTVYV